MDQLRKVLGWLKRQHFWVLSVLVALIAVGCWWKAAGTLSAEYKRNESTITSGFKSLADLRQDPFHPNDTINQQQIAETKKQAVGVNATWQQLYDRQREQVLEWPAALSQEFRDYVEKRKFGDEIPSHLRDNYQNYAEGYFPKLPEIVGARVMRAGEVGGAYGGGEFLRGGRGGVMMEGVGEGTLGGGLVEEDDNDYICEWLDQVVVRDKLNFPERPSALSIWVTQEDLWVYKTLLNVIRNTNNAAGANRMSNAAVRVIQQLEVGRPAAQYSRARGRIYMVPSAMASPDTMMPGGAGGETPVGEPVPGGEVGREPMPGGEMAYGGGYGGRGEVPGGGPMTPDQEKGRLLSYRYLYISGKPIPSGGGGVGVEVAAEPVPAEPTDAGGGGAVSVSSTEFGVEYRRLPVRMTLQMDQRWLSYLIAQCASQPLQVEVQEVRINPSDLGSAGGGYGESYGSSYGSDYGGRGGYPGRGGEGGYGMRSMGGMSGTSASPFAERTGGIQAFSSQPNLVTVVIQGIIYIFNEPDPAALEISAEPPLAGP